MKSKALERGGEVDTVKSLLAGNHITNLIPALFFYIHCCTIVADYLVQILIRERNESKKL